MAKCLFRTKVRSESHAKLEEVLDGGKWPAAECRETADEYSVWTDGSPAEPDPKGVA